MYKRQICVVRVIARYAILEQTMDRRFTAYTDMFFTAVLRVAEKRFTADAAIIDSMMQLQRNKEKGGKGGGGHGPEESTDRGRRRRPRCCGEVLYTDVAGIMSSPPNGLEKMMTCAVFGLTVSEAKAEIICLQTKGGGHVPFTVAAIGQVYRQTVEFVHLGRAFSADWDLRSVEIMHRIQKAWACFGRYKMEI